MENLRTFANQLWKYMVPKLNAMFASNVSYFRAQVVSNPGNNMLEVQRPLENGTLTLPCTDMMAHAKPGQQVVALVMGSLSNAIVVGGGKLNIPVSEYGPSTMVLFEAGGGRLPVRSCRVAGVSNPVTVYRTGLNLVGFPQPQYSTHNGVTLSVTDGELMLGGTATGAVSPFPTAHSNTYADMPLGPFPPGTYTITCTGLVGQSSNDRVVFTARTADNATVTGANSSRISAVGIPDGSGNAKTFTSTQPFKLGFYAYIASGTTVNCTVKVQMARASELPQYEKYCGVDSWTYNQATDSLTPPVMTALAGINSVWSDSGDVTVEYGRFLQAMQQEIEKLQ